MSTEQHEDRRREPTTLPDDSVITTAPETGPWTRAILGIGAQLMIGVPNLYLLVVFWRWAAESAPVWPPRPAPGTPCGPPREFPAGELCTSAPEWWVIVGMLWLVATLSMMIWLDGKLWPNQGLPTASAGSSGQAGGDSAMVDEQQ